MTRLEQSIGQKNLLRGRALFQLQGELGELGAGSAGCERFERAFDRWELRLRDPGLGQKGLFAGPAIHPPFLTAALGAVASSIANASPRGRQNQSPVSQALNYS